MFHLKNTFSKDCTGNNPPIKPGEQFDENFGHLTSYAVCPDNTLITGLQTKADTSSSDSIGLIDAKFYCQYVPNNRDVKNCYNF